MWVGQAGGFGGGRRLDRDTDGTQVPELSPSNLLSSQGDASKRSGRLAPALLSRAPWGFLSSTLVREISSPIQSGEARVTGAVREHISHQCYEMSRKPFDTTGESCLVTN